MNHLEAMRAEFAQLQDLFKGKLRKNQPGYHRVKRQTKSGKTRWEWVHEDNLTADESASIHRMGIASLSAHESRANHERRAVERERGQTGLDPAPHPRGERQESASMAWQSAAQTWLTQASHRDYQAQLAAHLRQGRKKSTFRYSPEKWHRDAMDALARNDEEGFKAIRLDATTGIGDAGHTSQVGRDAQARRRRT